MTNFKSVNDSVKVLSAVSALNAPPCSLSATENWTDAPAPLSVKAAFQGKVIFITGATGFVGSVTLEQILRVCDVAKVYLLIRPKAGRPGQERLESLLKTRSLFQQHTQTKQALRAVLNKIVVLEGDVHRPNCGLGLAELARLRAEVDIVIHSAASISFFEHIHVLLKQNYQATKEVAEMAASMHRLQALIHVSTCYVNAHRPRGSHVEEALYPLVMRSSGKSLDHAELAAKLAALPSAKATKVAAAVLKDVGHPNPYTLTKHMAESLVASMHASGALPAAIVRPSIIGGIATAPVPGYIGNAAGLTSAILAYASGMARFTCHDPYNVWDLVPCDVVASTILLTAAATCSKVGAPPNAPLIAHAATSTTYPSIYHELFEKCVLPFWQQHPPRYRLSKKSYKSIWDKNAVLQERSLTFQWLRWRQGLRLRGVALTLNMAGQGKIAAKVLSGWKVWKLYNTGCMDFHLFFCCANVRRLASLLPEEERQSIKPLWQAPDDSWEEYINVYLKAVRARFYDAHDKPKEGSNKKLAGQATGIAGSAGTAGEAPPLLVRGDTARISPIDLTH